MPEPDGRRRRPAMSCSLCRKRKIRCNRELPCSNCLRSRNEACVYDSPRHSLSVPRSNNVDQSRAAISVPIITPRQSAPIHAEFGTATSTVSGQRSSTTVTTSADSPTPASHASTQDSESMRLRFRIQQLEDQLANSTLKAPVSSQPLPNSNIETTNTQLGGTFHVNQDRDSFGQHQAIYRSVIHKTRLLGQSHWAVNVLLIRDIFELFEKHLRENKTNATAGIDRCKSLARVIKARRAPSWPTLPTRDLPAKEIVDTLIDCYLKTTESIYRILHIPTFRQFYDALWALDSLRNTEMSFIIQLKLVLAIGATTYDKEFALRIPAIRWIYEAQTWLSEPKFKSRLDIPFLQTNLLLLIAQERVGVGGEIMWVSIGSLFRKSICIGLHRDPIHLPQRSTFAAEMRRRLWNTILEMMLQSSLTYGGPPLFSLNDFDTQTPGNYDDDQLMADDPVPKPMNIFTQTSVSIALRKTFPQRLAMVKFLNDLSSPGTYEETLRLDKDLRQAYKDLGQTFREISKSSNGSLPPKLDTRLVDFLMHRYMSSLHVPYFGPGLQETAYAYSRKVVVESSLKIWRAAYPSSSPSPSGVFDSPEIRSEWEELPRLAICCSGFYPTVAIQAAFLIAIELRTQAQEEESLGPIILRPDLLSVLGDAKEWCLSAVRAGETNVKGFLLMSVITAQIEGLISGGGQDGFAHLLTKAVENVEEQCLPILEAMVAALDQGEGATDGILPASMSAPPGDMEEWAFMTSDALFNVGFTDEMGWVLNDETNSGIPSLW